MKKYIITFILNIHFVAIFGQGTPNIELQNFSPKSPEANAFIKQGEYPVDLSTGVANVSFPIYTIQCGDYSLPITLNYHPSGIKVSDEATWVGLGWNLNMGAQIISEVRDGPDEYNRIYDQVPTYREVATFMTNNPLGYFSNFFQPLKENSWIRDVYNFTSPTANGKFVIDNLANKEITIYPPDAFKVELTGGVTSKKFKITDPSGNIYYFTDTREYSQTIQQYQPPLYTSAWFVDKIETAKHDIINFTYIDGGNITQYNYGEKIVHTRTIDPNCGRPIYTEGHSPILNDVNMLSTKTKKIYKIEFNSGQVLFNSSSGRYDFYNVNDRRTFDEGPKKLDNIDIQAKTGNTFVTVKKTEFTYSYFISGVANSTYMLTHRLKLDKISNELNPDTAEDIIFTYSNIPLPNKNSKSIDFWGYSNGKFNLTAIPHQNVPYSQSGYGSGYESIGNANREVNPLTIEAGILKEIKYATKGITKFEYEPNMYYGVNSLSKYLQQPIASGHTTQGTGPGNTAPDEATIDEFVTMCPVNCIQYQVIPFEAVNAEGILSFEHQNPVGNDPTLVKHQYGRVRVFDGNNDLLYDSGKMKASRTVNERILPNGSCKIVVEAYGSYMSITGISFKYYNNDNSTKNNIGGGLRIKTISSYNENMVDPVSVKMYEYNKNENPTQSSGTLIKDISTTFRSNDITNYSASCCNPTAPGEPFGCEWLEQTNTSFHSNSINGNEGNSVTYSEVTEKNLSPDNRTNGYTVNKFTTDADFLYDRNGIIRVETGYKRGKLLTKEIFKAGIAGNPLLVNKQINVYNEDDRKIAYVKGFKLFQHHYINSPYINGNISPLPLDAIFEIVDYAIPVSWFYQKSTENIDYFYNSADIQTGQSSNKIDYFYDNPNHLQLTRIEKTNSKNEVEKSINYYPDDLLSVSQMLNLKSQNRINEIIKTENYKNGVLTDTQNKIYEDWGNNIIAPAVIQTAKGNAPLENRVQYSVIDNTTGNAVELRIENGTFIVYIWGYNKSQPIAKIENANYTDIQTYETNLQNLSNIGTEANLIIALNNLRANLPNAMVTTYTYKPLVGVSTITDPKGNQITYTYDTLGRLQSVKDKDNKILTENQYHYRTQN
ncbi:MAG TPA: RHS repeat domain-containing protein [Flavobacterium sp.]|jgi:YD repeat-containing protein